MSNPNNRWGGFDRKCTSLVLLGGFRYRVLLIGFACFVLGSCTVGIREFEQYRGAFAEQFAEGVSAIKRFGVTERKLWREIYYKPEKPTFEPDYASYYVDAGDPPLAKTVHASLIALKSYNDSLASLANGNSAEQLSVGIGEVATNLLRSSSNLKTALEGPKAVAAAGQLIADIEPAIGTAVKIFKAAATVAARESFRKRLLRAYPSMRIVLVSLRDYTPQMFAVMHAAVVDSEGDITDQNQLDGDRKLLASWVLLMDASLIAMDAAHEAIKQGKSNLSLTALNEATFELRVLSETLRDERIRE